MLGLVKFSVGWNALALDQLLLERSVEGAQLNQARREVTEDTCQC